MRLSMRICEKSCNFAARKKNRGMLLGRLTVCD